MDRLPWPTSPINNPGANFLITNSQSRSKEGKSRRMKGRPVGNDVTVEILKDRIPTVTCKSLRKRRSGFRTFSTSRETIHYCFNSKGNSYDASKNAFCLTEAIHFGNDFNSSVASLRSLDAFPRNRWCLSIGIAGGLRRNTHPGEVMRGIRRFSVHTETRRSRRVQNGGKAVGDAGFVDSRFDYIQFERERGWRDKRINLKSAKLS